MFQIKSMEIIEPVLERDSILKVIEGTQVFSTARKTDHHQPCEHSMASRTTRHFAS